jgi:hypothetical protein
VACCAEHPILMELARPGVVVIHGIDYKDVPADAARWHARRSLFATGADRDRRVGIE